MNATTTPVIAVVPRTADAYTVEGLHDQTFPDLRRAVQVAAQRNVVTRLSTWVRRNGERCRLVRF